MLSAPVTIGIVIITVLLSMQGFSNPELLQKMLHRPYSVNRNKEYHRWLTSGFVHKDMTHLGVNMFVFWQFGAIAERFFSEVMFGPVTGAVMYLFFYLAAIVFSDLPYYARHKDDPYRASLGASGAVGAILFACMLIWPWETIYLFLVIPIPFVLAGVLYVAYESYSLRQNRPDARVNHSAHLFGALFGMLGLIAMKPDMMPFYWAQLTAVFR